MDQIDNKTSKMDGLKIFLFNFVVPLTSLVLIVVVFFVGLRPLITSLPVLRVELETETVLADALMKKYQKLNSLLDFKTSVEENNILVSDVLASEPLVPQLLTQIDIIARESGLAVSTLNYSIGDAGGTALDTGVLYKMVSVQLGARGTYNQMTTFLSNLENAGRLVDISSLRFSAEGEDANLVSVTFVLVSPYVELSSTAVTDAPIEFDINNIDFQQLMVRLKELKIYRISVDQVIDISQLEVTEPVVEAIEEVATEPASQPESTP